MALAFVSMLDVLTPLVAPVATDVLVLEGNAKYTGNFVRVLYVGNGVNLPFLQGLFFDSAVTAARARFAHPALVPSNVTALPNIDVALTDLPRGLAPLFSIRCDLVIPAWIRQQVEFTQAPERRWLISRSIEREAARQQRQHHYQIDVTDDRAAFRSFFQQLYRPYIASRFGSEAIAVSESVFLKRCEGHWLARVHQAKECVAGMLLLKSRQQMRFGWFGAISDPPPRGVSEVLDVFCLHHARDSGIHRVVLGHSRPNLNDGVLRYKAKFGAHIVPTLFPQTRLGIRVHNWSNDILECLRQQPLISQRYRRCYVNRPLRTEVGVTLHTEVL